MTTLQWDKEPHFKRNASEKCPESKHQVCSTMWWTCAFLFSKQRRMTPNTLEGNRSCSADELICTDNSLTSGVSNVWPHQHLCNSRQLDMCVYIYTQVHMHASRPFGFYWEASEGMSQNSSMIAGKCNWRMGCHCVFIYCKLFLWNLGDFECLKLHWFKVNSDWEHWFQYGQNLHINHVHLQ